LRNPEAAADIRQSYSAFEAIPTREIALRRTGKLKEAKP